MHLNFNCRSPRLRVLYRLLNRRPLTFSLPLAQGGEDVIGSFNRAGAVLPYCAEVVGGMGSKA